MPSQSKISIYDEESDNDFLVPKFMSKEQTQKHSFYQKRNSIERPVEGN